MGKSKAHYRQLARTAENAAVRAVNDGNATDEQAWLAASTDKRFRQQRLDRLKKIQTKGDRTQACDRRDGIGSAPTVGAGNAENAGKLRYQRITLKIERNALRITGTLPAIGATTMAVSESRKYERLAIGCYQLVEKNGDPYLRLIPLGSGSPKLLPIRSWAIAAIALSSWLSSDAIASLLREWQVLEARASDYRP